MKTTMANKIAMAIDAMKRCNETNNPYADNWLEKLGEYEKQLPHGSGVDNGSSIDIEKSTANKLLLHTAFHHMDINGFYDGWTEHDIIITPSFSYSGFDIKVTGKNRNDIKNYLFELFHDVLSSQVE